MLCRIFLFGTNIILQETFLMGKVTPENFHDEIKCCTLYTYWTMNVMGIILFYFFAIFFFMFLHRLFGEGGGGVMRWMIRID